MKFDLESVRKAATSIGVAYTVAGTLHAMFVATSGTGSSISLVLFGIALIIFSNLRK